MNTRIIFPLKTKVAEKLVYNGEFVLFLMENNIHPWPVVCAIDFGMTYSGYAYSMRADYERDPLTVESNQTWPHGEMLTLKTPTSILFDKSGNFHSFGYEAEKKYAEIAEEVQEKQDTTDDEDSDHSDDSDDTRKKDKVDDEITVEWLFFRRFKMMLFQKEMVGIFLVFMFNSESQVKRLENILNFYSFSFYLPLL